MSTEPLRKMRDEMASLLDARGFGVTNYLLDWHARLTTYLAVPRCPSCGTTANPSSCYWHGNAQYWVECRACEYRGPYKDTNAEALAAFYRATTEAVKK
jgi:Zn ribbon nucleic-acid-binding protein